MSVILMIRMIFNALLKPKQKIILMNLPDGKVIDIGGGGEGVIAQVSGHRVIAIDKRVSEIYEARGKGPSATWLVSDGMALPFKRDSFKVATAYFSFMYMPRTVISGVLKEAHRVLNKNGELLIWDVNIPPKKKLFAISLKVDIPKNRSIKTIYGVRGKEQSVEKMCEWIEEAGLEPKVITNNKHWYLVRATKA